MFTTHNQTRLIAFMSSLIAVFFVAACSSEPEPEPEPVQEIEAAAEAPQQTAPQTRRRSVSTNTPTMEELPSPNASTRHRFVPEVEGQLDEPGSGLQSIIDGSSAETFKDSLAWIASDTSAEQYQELEQAIRFLNAYDPAVLGNDDNMRQRLDGLTGEEVIELAAEITRRRSGQGGN